MAAPKGHKRYGGRKQGSSNKVTADLRQSITEFLENNFDEMKNTFAKLEPKDKIIFYEKLLKYAVPTLQATELTTDFEKMTDEQLDCIINELKNSISNEPKRKD